MILLIFFISLTQIFSYWIFEPLTAFLTHLLEIRFLPTFSFIHFYFSILDKKEESNIEL